MGEPLRVAHDRNFALEARIRKHLHDTSMPETCSGLDTTPAPKAQDYEIIKYIALAPEKRPDRAGAPCPLCSPQSPKFYLGALAWFPHEGIYRFIGRECAKHAIGLAQAEGAERRHRERESHDADYDFAFDNVTLVPAMLAHLRALEPILAHAENLLHAFGRSHVRALAYSAVKANNGRLILWEPAGADELEKEAEETDRRPQEPKKFVPVDMGTLSGYECLGRSFHALRDVRIQIARWQALDHGDGEAAQAWILDRYGLRHDLAVFRKSVATAKEVQRKAAKYLAVVQAFLCPSNFELLARYGSDHRNPQSFFAAHRSGEFRAGLSRTDAVAFRPNFATLATIPPWPDFSDPRRIK